MTGIEMNCPRCGTSEIIKYFREIYSWRPCCNAAFEIVMKKISDRSCLPITDTQGPQQMTEQQHQQLWEI